MDTSTFELRLKVKIALFRFEKLMLVWDKQCT